MTLAVALMGIVAAVFIWWAWKQGAYFGSVFLPGAIILFALLVLLLLLAPSRIRVRGPAAVALAAIVALAGWTLLSITWTSFDGEALQDFERAMLYAAVFALGLWTCQLAGRRLLLPLAVVAATGVVIGIVITITLATGTDTQSIVHGGATLRFPIGYRNAEAAFLLICLWPLIVLAAEAEVPWPARAVMVGAATMLIELVVLSQSRGSMPATAITLLVFLLLAPRRLQSAAYLALAAVPALAVLPILLDVFQFGREGPGVIPFLRDASRAIALSSLASVGLAALCIGGIESRLDLGQKRVQLISRVTAGIAIALVVVGGTVFFARQGGPIDFVDERITEFEAVGYPDLSKQDARFGTNVGSNRHDFWRVALDQGADHPLRGGGPGSWAAAYLQERKSGESPQDPHSLEMLILSELGVVGLLILGTFVVSAAIAGLRTRRLGRAEAALAAGSLTSGAYWLVHASYDWFWHYPALTAPVMFLLGAAATPPLLDRAVAGARRVRIAGACLFGVALLIAVPLFLSQRYADSALDDYPDNPDSAISNLERAADLDPYAPRPLLAKGLMELELGRQEAAAASFGEAIDREPEGYAGHYFLARALARLDPGSARAAAGEALRLNPLDEQVRILSRRLQPKEGPRPPKSDSG